jgi:O-antigen biosynthesis protein
MTTKIDCFKTDNGPIINEEPLVSVIVPTYNAKAVIRACLDSLLKIDYSRLTITVVDDSSQDGTAELVREHYPGVNVLSTPKNMGFAGSVNLGIRRTEGDILALLNMDTVVDKMWLRPLVEALISDKNVGLVGSKIFFEDNKTLQHAGGLFRANGVSVHIGRGELDQGQYDDPMDVGYLCGASIAFRRELLETVGLFDEGYRPLYYEDTDFAFRIKKKGFKIRYIPESRLIHKENVSTQGLSDTFYYHYHRSRLRFIFKSYKWDYILNKFAEEEKRWFSKELPADLKPLIFRTYLSSFFVVLKALVDSKLLKKAY